MPDRSALDALLSVQEQDTSIDRLRHRRDTLPERAALGSLERELAALTAQADELAARRDELTGHETGFDDEARQLETRAVEVERRMYSGEIASPRELQAMQADVEQLRRHRRSVEDRELAIMEQRETADGELGRLRAEVDDLDARASQARTALEREEKEIDEQLAVERSTRDGLVGTVGAELLAEYERCRVRARGVGAARLVGGACQGCHLSIPATEAERIRKSEPGTIGYCDNCGCILVP